MISSIFLCIYQSICTIMTDIDWNVEEYKKLLQKSKILRKMLKSVIETMFDEKDVVTYNIIKSEFLSRGIEYHKYEVKDIVSEIQTEYTNKLTKLLKKYVENNERLLKKEITEYLEQHGIKYNEHHIKTILKPLRKK